MKSPQSIKCVQNDENLFHPPGSALPGFYSSGYPPTPPKVVSPSLRMSLETQNVSHSNNNSYKKRGDLFKDQTIINTKKNNFTIIITRWNKMSPTLKDTTPEDPTRGDDSYLQPASLPSNLHVIIIIFDYNLRLISLNIMIFLMI